MSPSATTGTSHHHSSASTSDAQEHTRKWLEILARFGYAARGAIYLIIGGLALIAAFGSGGQTTGTKGAILKVLQAPGGWLLVALLAVGLVGYSVWRFCQSIFDADRHGTDGKGMAVRAGLFVSSVTHMLLAVWAAKLAFGAAGSSGGSQETWVAKLMSQPFGQWLLGITACGLICFGVYTALEAAYRRVDAPT